MRSFCAGSTRAKTCTSRTLRRSASSSMAASARPVSTCASPPSTSPACRAIDRAVRAASPVIMTTRTPARRQASMAPGTSCAQGVQEAEQAQRRQAQPRGQRRIAVGSIAMRRLALGHGEHPETGRAPAVGRSRATAACAPDRRRRAPARPPQPPSPPLSRGSGARRSATSAPRRAHPRGCRGAGRGPAAASRGQPRRLRGRPHRPVHGLDAAPRCSPVDAPESRR